MATTLTAWVSERMAGFCTVASVVRRLPWSGSAARVDASGVCPRLSLP